MLDRINISAFGEVLANGLALGTIVVDKMYRVILWNHWMEKHTGIRENDIIGENIFEKFPDIRQRNKERYVIECVENRRPFLLSPLIHGHFMPLEIVKENKTIQMLQDVRIYPLPDKGEVIGAIIIIRDLTEQILHEKEILRLTRILKGIRAIDQLIVKAESESELLTAACSILVEKADYRFAWIGLIKKGTPDSEPIFHAGIPCDIGISGITGNNAEYDEAMIGRSVRDGKMQFSDNIQKYPPFLQCRQFVEENGCKSACCLPLKLDNRIIGVMNLCSDKRNIFHGEELELLGEVADDISFAIKTLEAREKRRQAEANIRASHESMRLMIRELKDARESAEAGNRAKTEFIGNMSHEFRTPMNIIIGMTDLVLTEQIPHHQRKYLGTARKSADSLLEMINDILVISNAEAGRLNLKETDFEIETLLASVLTDLASDAHQKGLELTCFLNFNVPIWIRGDSRRLRQILIHIIGNAIKFTEKGEVAIRVEKKPKKQGNMTLEFSVSDTGIGIHEDMIDYIFGKFTQADGSNTRRYDGAGLGTTISKLLVEMMGGEIWAESTPGQGSTFHFTIRAYPGHPVIRQTVSDESLRGLSVLIADENATSRRILTETVSKWNMIPIVAENGAAALKKCEEIRVSGGYFSLAVVDTRISEKNDFEVVRQIQQMNSMALIFLSSLKEKPPAYQKFPHTEYLCKPVLPTKLLETMVAALDRQKALSKGKNGIDPAKKRFRVLVADDNLLDRHMAFAFLEDRGDETVVLEDVTAAADIFEREHFDMVLVGIRTPRIDFYLDAARAIRDKEKKIGTHTPMAAMIGYASQSDLDRCIAAGMDDYIIKPFQYDDFMAAVERIIRIKG